MAENSSNMNIYQKLAKVRKTVEVIQKNASGYGYKYVSEDEILAKTSGAMEKYGVSLIPEIVPGTFKSEFYTYTKQKRDKSGNVYDEINNEIIVNADMEFIWVNNDNPEEKIIVPWAMVGHQTDGSQGFGTALSYAYRYFLLKYFGIATPEDDPDKWRSKQKEAEEAESKKILEKIIGEFDTMVREYLASHDTESENIKKFICKYSKTPNYFTIKDPSIASKMVEEFKETYMK